MRKDLRVKWTLDVHWRLLVVDLAAQARTQPRTEIDEADLNIDMPLHGSPRVCAFSRADSRQPMSQNFRVIWNKVRFVP